MSDRDGFYEPSEYYRTHNPNNARYYYLTKDPVKKFKADVRK
jgi:hypothetical protein